MHELPPPPHASSLLIAMEDDLCHTVKGKRDEWDEDGVLSLLEIYESKWLIRNRAKIRCTDWEDIALQVSKRCSASNALKTPRQCKNKVESMKKRYRSESAAAAENPESTSSWQFFARMDELIRSAPIPNSDNSSIKLRLPAKVEEVDVEVEGGNFHEIRHEHGSRCSEKGAEQQKNGNDEIKESRESDSDASSRRCKEAGSHKIFKKRRGLGIRMMESIQFLTHSLLKIEQVRMETFMESERFRAEAEIKKEEMDLKKAEIIAKTQLEIAKLLSKRLYGKRSRLEGSPLKGGTDATANETPTMLDKDGACYGEEQSGEETPTPVRMTRSK